MERQSGRFGNRKYSVQIMMPMTEMLEQSISEKEDAKVLREGRVTVLP